MNCDMVRFYVEKFTYEDAVENLGRKTANEMYESYDACVEKAASWFVVPANDIKYLVKTMNPAALVYEFDKGVFDPEALKEKNVIEEYYDLGSGDWREAIEKLAWSILSKYVVNNGLESVSEKYRGNVAFSMKFNVPAAVLIKVKKMMNPNFIH